MLKLRTRKLIRILLAILLGIAVACGIGVYVIRSANYTFARTVSHEEQELRLQVISTAESWLGTDEGTAAHSRILDIYNTHEPLAQGYEVQTDDNWCATFVSAVAIQCGLTDIIPTECGCQRQIGLFQEIGRWVEDDSYEPLPGDVIYYCSTDGSWFGDCTGWSDHVGIVVGTRYGFIKVIEGNNGDSVKYRYIPINFTGIRGYATPDYESKPPAKPEA